MKVWSHAKVQRCFSFLEQMGYNHYEKIRCISQVYYSSENWLTKMWTLPTHFFTNTKEVQASILSNPFFPYKVTTEFYKVMTKVTEFQI